MVINDPRLTPGVFIFGMAHADSAVMSLPSRPPRLVLGLITGLTILSTAPAHAHKCERELVTALRKQLKATGTVMASLPIVELAELESLETIVNPEFKNCAGAFNWGLMTGFIGRQKVFVKRLAGNFEREAGLVELMHRLGFGPSFRGLAIENGRPVGIVTDFIEGQHVYAHHVPRVRIAPLALFLASIGIQARELQFRMDRVGRLWLVDTGAFVIRKSNRKASLSKARAALQATTLD